MDSTEIVKKLLLIGNPGAGKSMFLLSAVDQVFNESYLPTIGVDFKIRTFEIGNESVKLQIWDTAGQERFRTITSSYYKGAHACLILIDLSERDSLEAISYWIGEVTKNASSSVKIVVVGTKTDIRVISKDAAQTAVQQLGLDYYECSARDSKSTFEVMTQVATILVQGSTAAAPESADVQDLGAKQKDKLIQLLDKLKKDQQKLQEALEQNQEEILKVEAQIEQL